MKATHLCAIILALSSFVPAQGNDSQMCEDNPLMEVEGGVWVCTDPIIYGTKCELDCTDPHSIPEGDYEVFCTPEGWFPDPAQTENPPICVSHPCDPLPNTTYGEWECHHVKGVEGEVCTLNCDDFYDPETANTTVCAASQWHPDPSAMSCITCKVPSPPSHGHWNCQDFDDIPSYNYTARVCAVHCDVGYTHAGNNITICSMTGENTWSPEPQLSICQEIIPECEAPDLPPHGRWECGDTMQSCLMACEDGFAPGHEVEIGCGLEGDWCSADMGFACQPACEDLPALMENGTWSCEEREPPYLECFLKCDNGTMMIGDGIVSCGLGQLWTGEDDNCTGCPFDNEFMDNCYELVDKPTAWDVAAQDCENRGGALASVQNVDVNTFLEHLSNSEPYIWIGGSDTEHEGVWKWTNGEEFTYTNWNTGEPNNSGGDEGCLELCEVNDVKGKWNDLPCSVELPYICQFPMMHSGPAL